MSVQDRDTAVVGRGIQASWRGDGLLRLALKIDAVVTGLNGAAYLILADVLDGPLGVSSSTQRLAGMFLVAFSLAVWVVGSLPVIHRTAVLAIIVANSLWASGSILFAVTGGSTSTFGTVWIALQAWVVAGFAGMQILGLRRARQAGLSSRLARRTTAVDGNVTTTARAARRSSA